MKDNKDLDEYKCIINYGVFISEISVSVIMAVMAIIFTIFAIETDNTELMIIEFLFVVIMILILISSIFSVIREAHCRFVINNNICAMESKKINVTIPVSDIVKIEIITIWRGAKKILIYGANEKLGQSISNDCDHNQTISLQFSNKRLKMIQKFCRNSVLVYKD